MILRSPIHQMSSLLEIVKHSKTEEDREEIMGFLNTSVDNAVFDVREFTEMGHAE